MRAETKRKVRNFFRALIEATVSEPKPPRAVCYSCKHLIRDGDKLYFAARLDENYWCACCGTKIRIESGAHQCVFFRGLVPGEID